MKRFDDYDMNLFNATKFEKTIIYGINYVICNIKEEYMNKVWSTIISSIITGIIGVIISNHYANKRNVRVIESNNNIAEEGRNLQEKLKRLEGMVEERKCYSEKGRKYNSKRCRKLLWNYYKFS